MCHFCFYKHAISKSSVTIFKTKCLFYRRMSRYNLLLSIVELYCAVNMFEIFKSVIPDMLPYNDFGYLCYIDKTTFKFIYFFTKYIKIYIYQKQNLNPQ